MCGGGKAIKIRRVIRAAKYGGKPCFLASVRFSSHDDAAAARIAAASDGELLGGSGDGRGRGRGRSGHSNSHGLWSLMSCNTKPCPMATGSGASRLCGAVTRPHRHTQSVVSSSGAALSSAVATWSRWKPVVSAKSQSLMIADRAFFMSSFPCFLAPHDPGMGPTVSPCWSPRAPACLALTRALSTSRVWLVCAIIGSLLVRTNTSSSSGVSMVDVVCCCCWWWWWY